MMRKINGKAATVAFVALASLVAAPALAQSFGFGPASSGYPMMGGYGYGYGMGPAIMAQGGWGPGMMYGYGPGPGAGSWMMGPYGYGAASPGWGAPPQGDLNLSIDQVKSNMTSWLETINNPNLKLGPVVDKDANTITADIVTTDKEGLVQRLEINRHNGFVRPVGG